MGYDQTLFHRCWMANEEEGPTPESFATAFGMDEEELSRKEARNESEYLAVAVRMVADKDLNGLSSG